MSDLSQELHGVTLLLERIIRVGIRLDLNGFGFDFKWLLGLRSQDESACNPKCCSDWSLGDLIEMIYEFCFINDLDGLKKRSVIQFDEAEFIGTAVGPYPSADCDFLICIFLAVSE